jgi:hypothetical protein
MARARTSPIGKDKINSTLEPVAAGVGVIRYVPPNPIFRTRETARLLLNSGRRPRWLPP